MAVNPVEVLREHRSDEQPRPAAAGVDGRIAVRELDIAYGGFQAVDGVTFNVSPGEFVCLLGPSGCGKSTVLNAVAGFELPSAGRIEVDGRVVTGPGVDRGIVFQQPSLFPWKTVRQNIAYGPRMAGASKAEAGAIADSLIEIVGLAGAGGKYPQQLSGGMQQRTAIARALANRPRLLLMDEPFGALDAQTRALMQEHLLSVRWRFGMTILFVTHDIDEAILLGDRILVMSASPGRLIADLPVDLPRSRSSEALATEPFMTLKRRCLDLLRRESLKAFERQQSGNERMDDQP